MREKFTIFLIIVFILGLAPINFSKAEKIENLATRLSGYILLQVESNGEAWYVNPTDSKRYYMKDGVIAYEILRTLSLGITNADLDKISVGVEERFEDLDSDGDGLADKLEGGLKTDPNKSDTDNDGVSDGDEVLVNHTNPLASGKLYYDNSLINRLKGRILLQVESKGEAWYINPKDGKRYYMSDGNAAYEIMRFLSLGITNENLDKIETEDLIKNEKQNNEEQKDTGDDDSDGLENWMEDLKGTDKNNPDTDNDYVLDGLDDHPLDNSSIINRVYKVPDTNTGLIFEIIVNVPLDYYIMQKRQLSHHFEPNASNITDYVQYNDPIIQEVLTQLIEISHDYSINWYGMIRNLVAQIVYVDDAFSGWDEYPKYPIETLVDGGGDCEDTSILLASLLRGFQWRWQTALKETSRAHDLDDLKVSLLVLPDAGHVATGYWVPEFNQIFDPTYKYYGVLDTARYLDDDGQFYCYIETTSNDYAPCEMPEQILSEDQEAYIYPIK
jgi:hypothetical protein